MATPMIDVHNNQIARPATETAAMAAVPSRLTKYISAMLKALWRRLPATVGTASQRIGFINEPDVRSALR
jgi:hypothetical protein